MSEKTNSGGNKRVMLEFTLDGHKHTFFKRIDVYGDPVATTNKLNARKVKQKDVKALIESLIKHYGKDKIADIKTMDEDI